MKPSTLMISLTFVGALILAMLPLPHGVEPYRPDWVALVLIFWCMTTPTQISVGWAFALGLLVDISLGSLLGQHAMAYVTIAYIVIKLHQRLRVYPPAQQAVIVFVLLVIQQTEILWIKGIIGQAPQSIFTFYAASLTGMLLWIWTYTVLQSLRRKYSHY